MSDGSFSNNYAASSTGGFSNLMRAFSGKRPPPMEFPVVAPDPHVLASRGSMPAITWLGHATFLIQIGGINIITDPHLTSRASPLAFYGPPRTTPAGLTADELPEIDVVLITHNHYDHLDSSTIAQLRKRNRQAQFLVPLRLAKWFGYADGTVAEFDWWEETEHGGARFTAVPTQHWSNRTMLDRNQTLWCSWVIEAGGKRILFVGDTGYTRDYADIRERFGGFDVAILPIGAYDPRWFMKVMHQNPTEAAQARRDLNAARAIASHWGTFQLTLEPMDEPPKKLQAALAEAGEDPDVFWVMKHGETRMLA